MLGRLLLVGLLVATVVVGAMYALISHNEGSGSSIDSTSKLEIHVYAPETCGCCKYYVEYLRGRGAQVEVTVLSMEDYAAMLREVPKELWSCHISVVEGYRVVGHVPLEVIEKLVREKPDVDGIALPGMPPGSPGMGGEKTGPLIIYYYTANETGVFVSF